MRPNLKHEKHVMKKIMHKLFAAQAVVWAAED